MTEPAITAPAAYDKEWSRDEALVEILRGRLEGLGPVTEAALAAPLGLQPEAIAATLAALETEGFALRGRFTPEAPVDEWCERRLLARIHRYTIKRLRAEIEPVSARDFLRFLFRWQRVAPDTQVEGPRRSTPSSASSKASARRPPPGKATSCRRGSKDYRPSWLDARCLAGHATWLRLGARAATRAADDGAHDAGHPAAAPPCRAVAGDGLAGRLRRAAQRQAQAVVDFIAANGASFFDELLQHCGLLRSQLEEALAELVALGLVTSDSFAGLRALLVPFAERKPGGTRRRRAAASAMEDSGRWSLVRVPAAADRTVDAGAVEHVARALLRRYGVVFWRMLEREASWLPPWRELLRVYRRLEGSGEIRGGRFVAGFTGEQFALPEAIGTLREVRRRPPSDEWTAVSGADPLNLAGILTPGPRLAALAGNRLLYRDGVPAATLSGGEIRFVEPLDAATEWFARKALVRGTGRGSSLAAEWAASPDVAAAGSR